MKCTYKIVACAADSLLIAARAASADDRNGIAGKADEGTDGSLKAKKAKKVGSSRSIRLDRR